MGDYTIDRKTVKTSRDLRWVALSWLDSFFLAMFVVTMDIPIIPLLILGIAATFFFLIGLATLLTPSVKYCRRCDDIFDVKMEKCPVCQTKLTTATPEMVYLKPMRHKAQTTDSDQEIDKDSNLSDRTP